MTENYVRRSKTDRRSNPNSDTEKQTYNGPERRSGKERRKWIDRMHEIDEKLNNEGLS